MLQNLFFFSFPGADDISLFEKFERQHKSNRYYSSPQMKQKEPYFTISHYASPVTYSIQVVVTTVTWISSRLENIGTYHTDLG